MIKQKQRHPKLLRSVALALLIHALWLPEASATEVAPYFYAWGIDSPSYNVKDLMDSMAKTGVTAMTLGFEISGGGCSLISTLDEMSGDIKNFAAAGGRPIISFGGANGPYLEDSCTNEDSIFNLIDGLLQRTGVRAIDFDIEGSLISMPDLTIRRTHVLKRLQAKYPNLYVSLTLPVEAPHDQWSTGGLSQDSIALIKATVVGGVRLSIVNLLTMNYYFTPPAGKTEGDLAIGAAEATLAQLRTIFPGRSDSALYAMIGMTPMIGQNQDGSVFGLSDASQVTQYAIQKGIGLVAWWLFSGIRLLRRGLAISIFTVV